MNRRRMNAVVSNLVELLRLAGLHPKTKTFLVTEHDAEHEHRHEA